MLEQSKQAAQAQAETEKLITELRRSHESREARVNELKSRVRALGKCEAELHSWQKREPSIRHYLGLLSAIAKYVHTGPITDLG